MEENARKNLLIGERVLTMLRMLDEYPAQELPGAVGEKNGETPERKGQKKHFRFFEKTDYPLLRAFGGCFCFYFRVAAVRIGHKRRFQRKWRRLFVLKLCD
ncbi:MAG: hypothetical protein V1777_00695 [Candidatus Micrarchaeota archaeon]